MGKVGPPILAAGAFQAASRLKAGCGHDCPAHPGPTERDLRGILRAMRAKSTFRALLIFAIDAILYVGFTFAALTSRQPLAAGLFGTLSGVAIAMLFVVGHDACHGSFTANRTLNGAIGRLAFLPSLTPFGSWDLEHNRRHHVYTNLKPHDAIWAPFSKMEYDALPEWRRALEHVYRSPAGVGLYYAIEIWGKLLIVPRATPGRRSDYWCCYGYAAALAAVGYAMGWQALLAGVVWPFCWWNWLMGWAIFDHHTHPDVPWFTEVAEWRLAQAQSRCTVHIVLPGVLDILFHRIMQHTAHHLDVTIPLYNLREAQAAVEGAGAEVVVYRWTPFTFLRHLRMCKLYDFENRRWVGFDGKEP